LAHPPQEVPAMLYPYESTESHVSNEVLQPIQRHPEQVEMGVMQAYEQRVDQEWEMEN